ncbi:dicarboxylate/amino acid:cation symporter [Phenylobacterium immobile]|uniref:dicarboxylate/amino acid:cation symporter n=1 Tax=Phenylobacterium immobile TaxID=21 RepID=UPI000AA2B650|nr:cation:dicarboxylase symporter family transporter [Phenylobacterium immobile]
MGALSVRILLGLVLGLTLGAVLARWAPDAATVALLIAKPIGALWLAALTMPVVPLIFGLVVLGVGGPTAAGGVAGRAFLWFAVLLTGACAVSAAFSTTVLTLWPPLQALAPPEGPGVPPEAIGGDWWNGFIPTNPVKAAAEMAVAPLVVFALFFGFAARRIEEGPRLALLAIIKAIVDIMLVIVGWVLRVGPIGVAALAVAVGAQLGAGAFAALLHYVLLASAACILIALLAYPLVVIFGRISPLAFAKACLPAQVVAFSTQSSLATLPAIIATARRLGVSAEAAGVVAPLAVSIFRASSASANVAVAIYLAHLHGVALSPVALLLAVPLAAVVSLAAVGLPGQVSFFATIAPICLALGVPIGMLPLLLAVESVPDLFRTVGNVTTDLAVMRIVGRRNGLPAEG